MTKDVLLTVSGLHVQVFPGEDSSDEPIEVVTPGSYYYKNGKHYVLYEEPIEGSNAVVKNKVRISPEGMLEIKKGGAASTHMIFEREKINMTQYTTPYGEFLIGVYTKKLTIHETEENIDVQVFYALDINGEKVADCEVRMNIHANGGERAASEEEK